jgi:hypothetical protein
VDPLGDTPFLKHGADVKAGGMSRNHRRIKELRILPPLAIGRLGAASTPMDNYTVELDPSNPLDHRRLIPATTFEIDDQTGAIARPVVPSAVTFIENARVRPVAPFLEVWALVGSGDLEPLTIELLKQNNDLTPGDVRWRVEVANHKIYRRTKKLRDKVHASTPTFSDHVAYPLQGRCANFWPESSVPLGSVRYIKPTPAFPEIRLRFTPAGGFVYGSSTSAPSASTPPSDHNLQAVVYDARKGKGGWLGYREPTANSAVAELTQPAAIYAGQQDGNDWVSKGYLDDECDGLVHVELTLGSKTLSAYARIGAGPPAYAPDTFPVRTLLDELEQAMHGPFVTEAEASLERAEEIIRRAFETMRLMNTKAMNAGAGYNNMARMDNNDAGRAIEPIMAPSLVENRSLLSLHQSVLTALRSGTAPWFVDVIRNNDQVGDLSAKGRRKMPALMRGADGRHLALTRRQVDVIRKVAGRDIFRPTVGEEPLPPRKRKKA